VIRRAAALSAALALAVAPRARSEPPVSEAVHQAIVMQVRGTLQKQRFRHAAIMIRKLLERRPEEPELEVLLGHALAGLHRCDEALALMLDHPEERTFGAEAARMAANCLARGGDIGQALYWLEQAVDLEPERPELRAGLAVLLGGYGEPDRARAIFESFDEGEAASKQIQTSWALFALSSGDVDEVDRCLKASDAVPGRPYPMRFFVEARLELDLGNPVAAEPLFEGATQRLRAYFPAINMWAESIRRQGDPGYAMYVLDNKGAIQNEALRREHTRAVRARILVDQGQIEAAGREIDDALAANPLDVMARASAWYLARARGDEAAMAEHAGVYDTLQASPLRRLERLVPLGG